MNQKRQASSSSRTIGAARWSGIALGLAVILTSAVIALVGCKGVEPPDAAAEYEVKIVPVKPASCQAQPQVTSDVAVGSVFTFINATDKTITIAIPQGLLSAVSDVKIELDPDQVSSPYKVQSGADTNQPDGGWVFEPDCQATGEARPRIVIRSASGPE